MAVLPIVIFFDLLAFGMVTPMLPFYAEHFGANPDTAINLRAIYAFLMLVSTPAWSRLSDFIGRKPVLVLCFGGAAASYILQAFASSLLDLYVARGIAGASAGVIVTSRAYVADITKPGERSYGMGLISASLSLAFVLGPTIGGVLTGETPSGADFRNTSLVMAALSTVALTLASIFHERYPDTNIDNAHTIWRAKRPERLLLRLARSKFLIWLIVISFLATFAFAAMEASFPLWAERQLAWGPREVGYLFGYGAAIATMAQAGLTRILARWFSETVLIIHSAIAMGSGLLILPFSTELPAILIGVTLISVGFGLGDPALHSLVTKMARPDNMGGMLGLTASAANIGRVFGPLWGGYCFVTYDRNSPYYIGAAIMAIVLGLGIALFVSAKRNKS